MAKPKWMTTGEAPKRGPKPRDPNKVYVEVEQKLKSGKVVKRRVAVNPENAGKYQQGHSENQQKWDYGTDKKVSDRLTSAGVKDTKATEQEFDVDNPNRQHTHFGHEGPHAVSFKHNDDNANIEHRDEIDKYKKDFYGPKPENWMDKNKVTFKEANPSFGGRKIRAQQYSNSAVGSVYFIDNDQLNDMKYHVAIPGKKIHRSFNKERDATNYLKDIFDRGTLAKSLDRFIRKSEIIMKINDLTSEERELPEDIAVLHKYKSGNTEVKLEGEGDEYTVSVNGSPVLEDVELKRAISKYYKEISNIIEAQIEDKDIGLDIFGEKVVGVNRKVIPKLANLGKSQDALWLKSFDYSLLQLPYNEDSIME